MVRAFFTLRLEFTSSYKMRLYHFPFLCDDVRKLFCKRFRFSAEKTICAWYVRKGENRPPEIIRQVRGCFPVHLWKRDGFCHPGDL